MKKRALFLDRDGIFNHVVQKNGVMHSPKSWDEIRHYEGLEDLKQIKELGYVLVMITNQPDIERGIVAEDFVKEVNNFYSKKFGLDAAYYCPFSSNAHQDKKPNPGMFLKAAKELDIDLQNSYHLGDTDRDVEGARNAGVHPILWNRDYNTQIIAPLRINSLTEVQDLLKRSI